MSEERKKEFVITILSEVQDQDGWDRNGDIKIQADITLPTNESKNAIGILSLILKKYHHSLPDFLGHQREELVYKYNVYMINV